MEPPTKETAVAKMLKAMKHRMLRRTGISSHGQICFGEEESASVDPIHPPSSKEPYSITAILDGEIFEFDSGIACGKMDSNPAIDSLYKKQGEDFVSHMDGTYSLVVWDPQKGKLFLVRDRLGTKPLYYYAKEGALVFASEIKGILASGLCDARINLQTLNEFLSFGYVPNPSTMFESVRQVKPGHMLIWEDGNVIEKRYWKYTQCNQRELSGNKFNEDDEYIQAFKEVFRHAVEKRLNRHPNAGAFLSGGLDTSSVVATMKEIKGAPFKVFTAGFRDERYNEIQDAKALVDHLKLDHYSTIIDFQKDFPQLLEVLIWHHDGPFADTSAVPSYFVAKLAREHVDTVLTGDFPDQLIGGSGHQVFALTRDREDPSWKKAIRRLNMSARIAGFDWVAGNTSFSSKIKRWLYRESFSLEEQRILMAMPIPPLLKNWLYSSNLSEINRSHDPLSLARDIYSDSENGDFLSRLLYFDILSYASDDLMVKVDRMSLAHGLNTISPFHDRSLIEFIATIPNRLKIRGTVRKVILREAMRPLLPESTLAKRKQGFAMPMGEWLKGNLSGYVREILYDSRTLNRGYFREKEMKQMVEAFLEGKTDYASGSESTIISLLTLELWHRLFIDR